MARIFVLALTVALLAIPGSTGVAMGATPTCGRLKATVVGTARTDLIIGTRRRDVIVARGGSDTIRGHGGRDVICGGDGRDTINGAGGADRIFGNGGNDMIEGGAGFDALDGGPGRDACHTGADGATQVACEDADLRVTVSAPASVAAGQAVQYTATVRNIGAKPSRPFELLITEDPTDVDCGLDLSISPAYEPLDPGAFVWNARIHQTGCQIEGGDPHLDIDVHVEPAGADADPSNDAASARIDITSP